GIAELLAELVTDLESLEGVYGPLRRAPPQTICSPDYMVSAVGLDVLAHAMHGHGRIGNGQDIKEAANLRIDVVDLRIALLDVHKDVVPGKVASLGIHGGGIFRLVGPMLDGRVINDEVEIGVVERRLLHVFGVGQMAKNAGLI